MTGTWIHGPKCECPGCKNDPTREVLQMLLDWLRLKVQMNEPVSPRALRAIKADIEIRLFKQERKNDD